MKSFKLYSVCMIAFLSCFELCAQQSSIDSLRNLKPDAINQTYLASSVITVGGTKDAIYDKLYREFNAGTNLRDDIAKNDPYVNLKMYPATFSEGNKDKLTYYVILNRKEFKEKKKFSLDENKSNTRYAFWRTESDIRDGQFLGLLNIFIKDNKIKYSLDGIKYVSGENADLLFSAIYAQMITYSQIGYNVYFKDFDELLAANNNKKKLTRQKEVKKDWNKIRQITLKSYDIFAELIEQQITKCLVEPDF